MSRVMIVMSKIRFIGLTTVTGVFFMLVSLLSVAYAESSDELSRSDELFIKHGLQFQAWTIGGTYERVNPAIVSDAKNILGRYIRVYYSNKGKVSLSEIEAYNQNNQNVARGRLTNSSDGIPLGALVDGDTRNRGQATSLSHFPWVEVDLGEVVNIKEIKLYGLMEEEDARWRSFIGAEVYIKNTSFGRASYAEVIDDPSVQMYLARSAYSRWGNTWENLQLTPAFFNPPFYNKEYFEEFPNAPWALQKGVYGYGDAYSEEPTEEDREKGFIRHPKLLENIDRLVNIGFGDEEEHLHTKDFIIAKWYEISKEKYPNAIIHNNQVGENTEWNRAQGIYWGERNLRHYVEVAKPDLITFDWYYYHANRIEEKGGRVAWNLEPLGTYRNVAIDDRVRDKIAFGQYMFGNTPSADDNKDGIPDRSYRMSESQLKSVANLSLTVGAKWLTIFTYILSEGARNMFFYSNGETTASYDAYVEIGKTIMNLSPHLSRLQTTEIRILDGKHLDENGEVVTNPIPENIWYLDYSQSFRAPYIDYLEPLNLRSILKNNYLPGDIIVGSFEPVDGLSTSDKVDMHPVPSQDTPYFMIMNAFSSPNGCCSIHESEQRKYEKLGLGSSDDTVQRVSVVFNLSNSPYNQLYRVRRYNGNVEKVDLKPLGNKRYTYTFWLGGGEADLFYWGNNPDSEISNTLEDGAYRIIDKNETTKCVWKFTGDRDSGDSFKQICKQYEYDSLSYDTSTRQISSFFRGECLAVHSGVGKWGRVVSEACDEGDSTQKFEIEQRGKDGGLFRFIVRNKDGRPFALHSEGVPLLNNAWWSSDYRQLWRLTKSL